MKPKMGLSRANDFSRAQLLKYVHKVSIARLGARTIAMVSASIVELFFPFQTIRKSSLLARDPYNFQNPLSLFWNERVKPHESPSLVHNKPWFLSCPSPPFSSFLWLTDFPSFLSTSYFWKLLEYSFNFSSCLFFLFLLSSDSHLLDSCPPSFGCGALEGNSSKKYFKMSNFVQVNKVSMWHHERAFLTTPQFLKISLRNLHMGTLLLVADL